MASEYAQIIGPLAQSFFGEPNRAYSSEFELRYGAKGSLAIDLRKGTWYDHEAEEGGGVLDLVARETHLTGEARIDWLKRHGYPLDNGYSNGPQQQRPNIVATYDYCDEGGELIYQVCRFEPKDFRQRRKPRQTDPPDKVKGGWVWNVSGVRNVPYHLPQLLENDDRVVCIVEGEKDADRLWKLGIPATCNAGGAGKWRDELSEFFRGADVVVIPDRDPQKKHPKTGALMFHPDGRPILPGQDHAADIVKSLQGKATRVRLLQLWDHWKTMPAKGDVSDWMANGGTAEQLYDLIDKTPVYVEPGALSVPLLYPFPIIGEEIPRRQWIVPGLLLRRNVTLLVAPPGSGKSLLTLQMGLMMSTGMAWGGWKPRKPCKVLVINAEDDTDEMRRRLYAAYGEMQITTLAELSSRLAIAQAPENIIVAKADSRTKTVVATPMVDRLVMTVIEHQFDVLVVDPFAETFEGDENSNSELKWAAVLWREIARKTGAAVMLVHHTRKFNAEAGDMDSARGGGALVGVCRNVSTLFAMTEEEAVVYGIRPDLRHLYLRFDDAKANLSLVTFDAKWFIKKTIELPNRGDDEPADEVGVLNPWKPTTIFVRVTIDIANQILDVIEMGLLNKKGERTGDLYCLTNKGRGNKRWAGHVVKDVVDCTPKEAQQLLDAWTKSGLLAEGEVTTSSSKGVMRKGLYVDQTKRPGTIISEDRM